MGKRFRKSFTFDGKRYFVDGKTQKEADEKAIKKRTELENHVRKVTEPKSISQWMDGWIDTYKDRLRMAENGHYPLEFQYAMDICNG